MFTTKIKQNEFLRRWNRSRLKQSVNKYRLKNRGKVILFRMYEKSEVLINEIDDDVYLYSDYASILC